VIGSLRGSILDCDGTELLVEVGGVGYRLQVTPNTVVSAGDVGDDVFVWVHHHIREDNQQLYGFTSRDERNVFEVLIGTHGVGPALALAILSVHTPSALRLALATDDVGALCLVPGVGKKTAARLLVELKSRLDLGEVDLTDTAITASSTVAHLPNAHADVREALVGLGYGLDEIAGALRELPADGDTSELLRAALQRLAAA
jgi:holliday junction DNA helicase RuvA